jgi:hypothetical protein
MGKNRLLKTFSLLLFICGFGCAQDGFQNTAKSHNIALQTYFFQTKDVFNYGLVYDGGGIMGSYEYVQTGEHGEFRFSTGFGGGAAYNKGIAAAIFFNPVAIYYGLDVWSNAASKLQMGGYSAVQYGWEFYPFLQSGQMFWHTTMDAGIRLQYTLSNKMGLMRLCFANSLFGFTSRPDPGTEKYFNSRSFSAFVSNAHSNLTLGTFTSFNHSVLEIALQPASKPGITVAYRFEYYGFYKDPRLHLLFHGIHLQWEL